MSDVEVLVLRRAPVPSDIADERLASLVRHALDAEGVTERWTVSIVLVDDGELQAFHRDFMDIDEPTDVMTFPADEPDQHGGDVIISVDRAAEQGPDHGHTPAQEIEFLVLHGVLHLCGWTDETDEARSRMLARQGEIQSSFL